MAKMNVSSSPLYLLSLFSISLHLLLNSVPTSAQSIPVVSNFASPAVHIIYTQRPSNEEPEAYDIRTLASVLGSEEAARSALVQSFKSASCGFSARLTPDQVAEISKQPGVLNVVQSSLSQLHLRGSGISGLH